MQQKIVSQDTLATIVRRRRQQGEKAVFTNGCFDLLHLGHVRYLQEARALGDFLIIGLNDDAGVRMLKGSSRPLIPDMERAEILAALNCVDYVTLFSGRTAESIVGFLQPALYVKGGDYATPQADVPAIDRLPEARVVQEYGGIVRLVAYLPGHSTTELIAAIKRIP